MAYAPFISRKPIKPFYTDTTDSARVARAHPAAPGAQTPPTPPTPPAPPAPPAAPSVQPNLDFSNNPIYQTALSHSAENNKGAAGQALSSYEQALLGYGSESLARQAFENQDEKYGNRSFRQELESQIGHPLDLSSFYSAFAGQDNPDTGFSTLAQLGRKQRTDTRDLGNELSPQNLFYSSTGAGRFGDLAYNSQLGRLQAQQGVLGQLGGFGQSYLQQLAASRNSSDQAAATAYQQALDWANAHPNLLPPAAPPEHTPQEPIDPDDPNAYRMALARARATGRAVSI